MNLGNILVTSGRIDEAEPLLRMALAALESRFGDVHIRTSTAINTLAYLVEQRGDLAEAESLYRRALAAVEALSGVTAADTLAPMNNLAMLLSDRGSFDDADALFVELIATTAIAGRSTRSSPSSPATADEPHPRRAPMRRSPCSTPPSRPSEAPSAPARPHDRARELREAERLRDARSD